MRNIYLIASFLFVFANTSFAQDVANGTPSVMIESSSQYGFAETVDKLTASIMAKNWKLIITHNMQETMKKNGKDVYPVKILELCNPEIAYTILASDVNRSLSAMLPCRISVYEKADGKTYVSRMNIPLLVEMIKGDASQSIMRAYNESEEFIRGVSE